MATSLQPVKSCKKPVEVVEGWILGGWAQKSPEPCSGPFYGPIRSCPTTTIATVPFVGASLN
jgi:hypothetical protein